MPKVSTNCFRLINNLSGSLGEAETSKLKKECLKSSRSRGGPGTPAQQKQREKFRAAAGTCKEEVKNLPTGQKLGPMRACISRMLAK